MVSEVMRTGDFAVEEVSLARSAAVVGGGWVGEVPWGHVTGRGSGDHHGLSSPNVIIASLLATNQPALSQ